MHYNVQLNFPTGSVDYTWEESPERSGTGSFSILFDTTFKNPQKWNDFLTNAAGAYARSALAKKIEEQPFMLPGEGWQQFKENLENGLVEKEQAFFSNIPHGAEILKTTYQQIAGQITAITEEELASLYNQITLDQ